MCRMHRISRIEDVRTSGTSSLAQESSVKISDDVVGGFDARRYPDQILANAHTLPHARCNVAVRGHYGIEQKTVNIAQRSSWNNHVQPIHKCYHSGFIGVLDFKAHD